MITMFRYFGSWEGKAKGRGQDTHTQTHHCFRTNDQDGQCFLSSLSSTNWNVMTAFIRKEGMVSHSFSCSSHTYALSCVCGSKIGCLIDSEGGTEGGRAG